MAKPTLIFCYGNNKLLADIAVAVGFKYGARLPAATFYSVYFADQNYDQYQKAKNSGDIAKCRRLRKSYMDSLAEHHPFMASVYDWMKKEELPEVLDWAEEAAQFVDVVMLIPKVQRGIHLLPRKIGGKPVYLGYSIPTTNGGTPLPYEDFRGWPVHLLGGSPQKQLKLFHNPNLNVVSVDGNMAAKQAHKCRFWRLEKGSKGHWINLKEVGAGDWGSGSNTEAFRRSMVNIFSAWNEVTNVT